MLEGWDNIEASVTAEVPGFAGARFVVNDDKADVGEKGGESLVGRVIEIFPG